MTSTPGPQALYVGPKKLTFDKLNEKQHGLGVFDFRPEDTPDNTGDQLEHIIQVRNSAKKAENISEYTVIGPGGNNCTTRIKSKHTGHHYVVGYRNTFARSANRMNGENGKGENKLFEGPSDTSTFYLKTGEIPRDNSLWSLEQLASRKATWDAEWADSESKSSITAFLVKHGRSIRRIDKVIGIGLGRPGTRSLETTSTASREPAEQTSYFQHLTILHVAEDIGKIQGHKVKIIVQDPSYTTA